MNVARANTAAWNADVDRIARATFGVTAFRPGQRQLIDAVLAGRDALGILPTGGGKSLCFQLPALMLPGLVLVISPLIALMDDQTARLEQRRVPAEKLDSTLTASEEREAHASIDAEHAEIVYTTPERLERPEALELFRDRGVSLLVIDEAHCVSHWGHDFRPAYLAIRDARAALGNPPVLALTATATAEVAADILTQLAIPGAEVVRADVERPNIFFEVRRTPTEDIKERALLSLLAEPASTPAIVYAATIKVVEETWQRLAAAGKRVARYHGRLRKADRTAAHEDFMAGRVDVMVATSAFGMGIDKANVRLVAHVNFPDSLETYHQEAGRAGRDGAPARAVLLYRLEDRRVQAYFLGGKYPKPGDFLRVWNVLQTAARVCAVKVLAAESGLPERVVKVIVAQLQAMGLVERTARGSRPVRTFRDAAELEAFVTSYEERRQGDREKLELMMQYAQSTGCRVARILAYFGQADRGACGHCDNCRDGVMVAAPVSERVPVVSGVRSWEAEAIAVGMVVKHRAFGIGVVLGVADGKVEAEFERAGVRTVREEFVQAGPGGGGGHAQGRNATSGRHRRWGCDGPPARTYAPTTTQTRA